MRGVPRAWRTGAPTIARHPSNWHGGGQEVARWRAAAPRVGVTREFAYLRCTDLPSVVVGASVILADPIFKGLAIALMAGEIASLLISRMAVPVLYFMANNTPGEGRELPPKPL